MGFGTRRRMGTILKKRHRMPPSAAIDNTVRENANIQSDTLSKLDGSTVRRRSVESRNSSYGHVGSPTSITASQSNGGMSPVGMMPSDSMLEGLPSDVTAKYQMAGSATSEDIFVERLMAWKRLFKHYEVYFDSIVTSEKTSMKNIDKALTELIIPMKDEHYFLGVENQGVQQMAQNVKEVYSAYSAQHTKLMQHIEMHTMSQFEDLMLEVKDNLKLYSDRITPAYRKLRKQVKQVEACKERLAKSIESYKPKHKTRDTWLLQQDINRELNRQAEIENALFKMVQSERERLSKWEATVMARLRDMMATLMTWYFEGTKNTLDTIQSKIEYLNEFDLENEPASYEEKFGPVLTSPMGLTGNSRWQDYEYKYKDDASTVVLLEGNMEREKGMRKRYVPQYLVLTARGFLHCYASQKDLMESDPEISFFLTDCTVSSIDQKNVFVIHGTDDQSSLNLGRSKHSFRATDRAYVEQWWNAISSVINNGATTSRQIGAVGGTLRDPDTAATAAATAATAPSALPVASGAATQAATDMAEAEAAMRSEELAAEASGAEPMSPISSGKAADVGDMSPTMPNAADHGGEEPQHLHHDATIGNNYTVVASDGAGSSSYTPAAAAPTTPAAAATPTESFATPTEEVPPQIEAKPVNNASTGFNAPLPFSA